MRPPARAKTTTQTPARLANSPGFKSFRCPRWRIKFSLERFQISRACAPSRWKVLSGEFRRRPTAPVIKFRKSDRVGRRGLFEPREDFSRLPTIYISAAVSAARIRISIPYLNSVSRFRRTSTCVPSRWKVLSGEFRRRPTALVIKFRKPDRVGRRGLSEPREDFSRLPTNSFPRLCPWLYPWLYPQPLFHPNFAAPLFDDTNNRRILP